MQIRLAAGGRHIWHNPGMNPRDPVAELLGAIGTAAGYPLDEFGRNFMLRPGMPVVEGGKAIYLQHELGVLMERI